MFEDLLPLEEVDNHENPTIQYHFINHDKGWEWWICAGEKLPHDNDYYFFGIGKIITKEMGFMTLSQIKEFGGVFDETWSQNKGLYDILKGG